MFVAIIPVSPKHGDRPVMSHNEWSSHSQEITEASLLHDHEKRIVSGARVPVHVDQLTGLDGFSIIGVESFFGRRSTSVVGYLTQEEADSFYREGDKVWIGSEQVAKLKEILRL